MVGLPRSGKTTRARELSKRLGAPIVCPDAVRLAIHGHAYIPRAEPIVWGVTKTMVTALFEAGHEDVILDACNNTRRRRDEWKFGPWEIVFEVVTTPPELCLQRAGEDHDLRAVIQRMDEQHEPVGEDEGVGRRVAMDA